MVRSSGGSFDGATAKIILCNALFITAINTSPTACLCNGTATVNATGGTTPYTYSWSSGSTSSTATGLCQGGYSVTVTDAILNKAIGSSIVGQSGATLSTAASSSPATCGNSNGSATVTVTSGTPPYTYNWSSGATTTTVTGLAQGTYMVTVSDGGGCTSTKTVNIANIAGPAVSISSHTDVLCNGGTNGSAAATLNGGTSPFSYVWNASPVQTTFTASNLAAGSYSVTVTDANSCITTTAVNITQPAAIAIPISSQTNVSCNGGNNGSLTVNPSGGTIPYSYLWNSSPVQTAATASNLTVGTYSVTVTDAHGCKAISSATITQPYGLIASTSSNSPVCSGYNLNFSSSVSGGTMSYNYSWSGPNSFNSTDANPSIPSVTTANTGTYNLTVTDAHSCTATATTAATINLCFTVLNLHLLIEGYYIGSGQMQSVMYNEGASGNATITDTILVALRDAVVPTTGIDSITTIVNTDGTASVSFGPAITGNSYYVVVKHRNTVETWSKTPVGFNAITNYDFTTGISKAYGDNMIQVDASPARWAFYIGDINQDQNIDLIDFPPLDLGINSGLFGYYRSDLNGDGNVDLLDFPVLDANINSGIFSQHP